MAPLSTAELLFRALVALFVVVTPSLMCIGLYRGLLRMRDDELVARLLVQAEREHGDDIDRYLHDADGDAALATTTCGSCGTTVRRRLNFCWQCGNVVEDASSSPAVSPADD